MNRLALRHHTSSLLRGNLLGITVCIAITLGGAVRTAAGPQFREYPQDKARLETYIDKAKDSVDAAQWESIVNEGKASLTAEWEKDALEDIDREVKDKKLDDAGRAGLEKQKDEAFAEWETLMDAQIAKEEGKWIAARENILYADFDKDTIRNILKQAETSLTVEYWDNLVDPVVKAVSDEWESDLASVLDTARRKNLSLDEKVRQEYLTALTDIEQSIKDMYRFEKNSLVYRARNRFITDLMLDMESLRKESEQLSGSAIADGIIAETETELSKDEEKLLADAKAKDGSEDMDLSKLGENWQEQLSNLLERGMKNWQDALDRLYSDMKAWRTGAQKAFDEGDEEWRNAYQKLYDARDAWQTKLDKEIQESIDRWQEREDSLKQNLDRAKQDFQTYSQTMNDQWLKHSLGLKEMDLTGARIYGESVENLAWLDAMIARYQTMTAYENNSQDLYDAVDATTGNWFTNTKTVAEGSLYNPNGLYESFNWLAFLFGGEYHFEWVVTSATYLDKSWNTEHTELTERYQITVYRHTLASVKTGYNSHGFFPGPTYTSTNRDDVVSTMVWEDRMTDTSGPEKRKSAYYIYSRERDSWEAMQETMAGIIADSELTMHDKNMLGESGGPGFLTWDSTENDPCLMTDAEREYELTKREMAYWERRLAIAQAVKDYALAGASREDAAATIKAKNDMEAAMVASKEAYETQLTTIQGIVAGLRKVQGEKPATTEGPEWDLYKQSISALTDDLEKAQAELKKADDAFQVLRRAVIVMENGQDAEFVAKELEEIERNLVQVERDIRNKSIDYFTKAREFDYAARAGSYAALYRDTVMAREEAKDSYDLFREACAGDEKEANIAVWVDALAACKEAIWGDAANARYKTIGDARTAWENAGADDKEAAYSTLTASIRNEYTQLYGAFQLADRTYRLITDGNFNAAEYLQNANPFDEDMYERAASLSRDAFSLIDDTMDGIESKGTDKTGGNLLSALKEELDGYAYRYGDDNREYMKRWAAYCWVSDALAGLDDAGWEQARQQVSDEEDLASAIETMYGNYTSFDPKDSTILSIADAGNMKARNLLFEYYNRGSSLTLLPYLKEKDVSLRMTDSLEAQIYAFVNENRDILPWAEQEINSITATDIITYINEHAAGFTLTEENLDTMGMEELSKAARIVDGYIRERRNGGLPVPASIEEMADKIATLRAQLEELTYTQSNTGMVGADQNLAEKEMVRDIADRALRFVEGAEDLLSKGGDMTTAGLSLLSQYDALDNDTKDFLNASGDDAVESVLDTLTSMDALRFSMIERDLATQFVDSSNGLDLTQFVAMHGTGLTEVQKAALTAYLVPFDEKRAYLAAGKVADIESYLSGRKLSGARADELRTFMLIDEYRNGVAAGDFTGLDPLFKDFATTGTIASLPDTVQGFIAANRYYDDIEAEGGYLFTGSDIDDYLEKSFGAGALSSGARYIVDDYIGSLGALHRFYGGDVEAYAATVSGSGKELFLASLYLGDDRASVVRPFADTGVYGISSLLDGETAVFANGMANLISHLASDLGRAELAIDAVCRDREQSANAARTLVKYLTSPADFASYRTYIATIYKDADKDKTAENTLITSELSGGTNFLDTVDTDTGEISMFMKGTEENGGSLSSMAIDAANGLHQAISQLFDTVKAPAGDHTVMSFLTRAGLIYDDSGNHTKTDGAYSFQTALESLVSEFDAVQLATKSAVSSLAAEMATLEGSNIELRASLIDRGKTYSLLGGNKDSLRQKMDAAAVDRRNAEKAYSEIQTALLAKQTEYETTSAGYIDAMNQAATLYADFQAKEYSYEKAYAVWEYANTPYLNPESYSGASGSSESKAPDAMENWNAIKAKYDTAAATLTAKETAKNNQQTVADLLNDAAYKAARDEFTDKTKSYLRADSTDTMLAEDISELRKEQDDAMKTLATKIATLTGSLFRTSGALTDEQELLRDKYIEKMMDNGGGNFNAYLFTALLYYNASNGIPESSAYGDDHTRRDFNYATYYLSQHPDWATLTDDEKTALAIIYDGAYDYTGAGINPLNYKDYGNAFIIYNPVAKNLDDRFRPYLNEKLQGMWNEMQTLYATFTPDIYNTIGYNHAESVNYDILANDSCSSSPCRSRNRRQRARRDALRAVVDTNINVLYSQLQDYLNAKNAYQAVTDTLNATARARDLDEARKVLGGTAYVLTGEETGRIYDTTQPGMPADGINITALRKETTRTDTFGRVMKAKVEGGRVYLIDIIGRKTGESYALDDISFILRNGSGVKVDIATLSDGDLYTFSDNTYQTAELSGVLKSTIAGERIAAKTAMDSGVSSSGTTHNSAVVLKDQESMYWDLLGYAKNVGADKGETNQRSSAGYATILSEYLYDGKNTSAQDRIVQALIAQNREFQEQLWNQKQLQFDERKDRWMETVGYIVNRGREDWTNNLAMVENEWRKWRMEAQETIIQGEKAWENALSGFKTEMNGWRDRASNATADAASMKMFEELSDTINTYVSNIRKNLPENVHFTINTDKLVADTLVNAPTDTIGVLSNAMKAVDTTVGFAKLFSLNLSGSLQTRFNEEMKSYRTSMAVMKNLRVMDLLNGIIDEFNKQLAEQNTQAYDDVNTTIRPNFAAPFDREQPQREWTVEVIWNRTVAGTEYKTLHIGDYGDYNTNNVRLRTLTGVNGQTIDFNDPTTFMNLEASELDTYVRLEQEHLSKEIDKVFGKDGTYSGHYRAEYTRLQNRFQDAEEDWLAGEEMQGQGFQRVQVWKGGPDVFTMNRIVGSVALSCIPYCGWALALAFNAACIAYEMVEGTINIQQGGLQVGIAIVGAVANAYTAGLGGTALNTAVQAGVGAATTVAASGVNYQADGGINYDFQKVGRAFKGELARFLLTMAAAAAKTQMGDSLAKAWGSISTGLTQGFMSGFDTRGSFFDFKWDTSHATEHLVSGLAAGVTSAIQNYMSSSGNDSNTDARNGQSDESESRETTAQNTDRGSTMQDKYPDNTVIKDTVFGTEHFNKLTSGGIYEGIMYLGNRIADGAGFRNENDYGYTGDHSKFNWNSMVFTHQDLGNWIGTKIGGYLSNKWDQYKQEKAKENIEKKKNESTIKSILEYGSEEFNKILEVLGYREDDYNVGDVSPSKNGVISKKLVYTPSGKYPNDNGGDIYIIESDKMANTEFWKQFAGKLSHWTDGGKINPETKQPHDLINAMFDISNKGRGGESDFYGPNIDFNIERVDIVSGYGGAIDLSYMYDGKKCFITIGHLSEINSEIINAYKNNTSLPAGTYLGDTYNKIGSSDGPHGHIEGGFYKSKFKIMYNRNSTLKSLIRK